MRRAQLQNWLFDWLETTPGPSPLWDWLAPQWRRAAQIVWIGIGCGALQVTMKHLGADSVRWEVGDYYVWPLVIVQWTLWVAGWFLVAFGIVFGVVREL